MKIPWKLTSIVAIMIIPILYGVFSIWTANSTIIEKVRAERRAVEVLGALRPLFEHLPEHRSTAAAALAGDAEALTRWQELNTLIDGELAQLAALDQQLGSSFGIGDSLVAVQETWAALSAAGEALGPQDDVARHAELIQEIVALKQRIALRGELIADPEPLSSLMIRLVAETIPETVEAIQELNVLGSELVGRGFRTLDDSLRLNSRITMARQGGQQTEQLLRAAWQSDERLRQTFEAPTLGTVSSLQSFLEMVETELVFPEVPAIPIRALLERGGEGVEGLFGIYGLALEELSSILQKREDQARIQRNLAIVVAIALTLLAAAVAAYFAQGITRQIDAVAKLFSQIGIGDFSARAKVISKDELGDLTRNLNTMLDNTTALLQSQEERDQIQQSIQKLLVEIADAAEGDLTVEAEVTTEVTGAIADSFNFLVSELRGIISRVQETTLEVTAAANDIQETAEQLARGSESQSGQIVDTTSAVDDMAVSIAQVSDNASAAAAVAQQALVNARQGNQAVAQTIEGMVGIRSQVQETAKRMKRLGESSQEVGEIVRLIGDIADRTSILALNASIQAAMAGEAGRGFAVVAEEVERLAERSADATKRIESLIKTIQIETSGAVGAMEETTREVVSGSAVANQAGTALQEIEGVSVRLAELIGAISQSAQQQAQGSESVARSMSEISEVTQQTAAGTRNAALSISNMAGLADELRESVSMFRLPPT